LIVAQELQLRIHQALHDGWGQEATSAMTFLQAVETFRFRKAVKETYKEAFNRTRVRLLEHLKASPTGKMKLSQITTSQCLRFLHSKDFTASSFNTERKHLSSLLSGLLKPLGLPNPAGAIATMKETPALHKPFEDVQAVFRRSVSSTKSFGCVACSPTVVCSDLTKKYASSHGETFQRI